MSQMPAASRWILTHMALGDNAGARAVLERAMRGDTADFQYRGYSGRIAASAGDSVVARRRWVQLRDSSTAQASAATHRAFISALLGNKEEAVQVVRESFAAGLGFYVRSRLHFFTDVRNLSGYAPFEKLISPED